MRISDWSSDVCSSDLLYLVTGQGRAPLSSRPLVATVHGTSRADGRSARPWRGEYERETTSGAPRAEAGSARRRSEENTSEIQSLMRLSYAVFCLKQKKKRK